jgi:hypothetical protein
MIRGYDPGQNCDCLYLRTAVEIRHEHDHAFVANRDTVTFCNRCQIYQRNAVSLEAITATGSASISRREAVLYRQSQTSDSPRQ